MLAAYFHLGIPHNDTIKIDIELVSLVRPLKCKITLSDSNVYDLAVLRINTLLKIKCRGKTFGKFCCTELNFKLKGCFIQQFFVQSSKDSTSPMSETCKIRAGQVKFQDRKPDWACKIVESKLKK